MTRYAPPALASCDPIAAGVDRRFHACCQPNRARRIQQRWQHDPALAGHDAAHLRRTISGPTAAGNPALAALLRAHQDDDADATSILLAAFIPYVCSDPAIRITPERVADRWAALAHLLAVVDPAEADRRDETRPFLRVLVGRMRRNMTRFSYGTEPGCVPVNDAILERHGRRTPPAAVEDQALARIDLTVIAGHLHDGTITATRWRRLVDDRIHGHADRRGRSSIRHTARRLAVLTGRVA